MKDARRLLKAYAPSKDHIATLTIQLSELVAAHDAIRAVFPTAQSDSDPVAAPDATSRLIVTLKQEIDAAAAQCELVITAFSSMVDTEAKAVLELHYLSGLTLQKIASKHLYCCLTTVKNLHRRGLAEVEAYLTEHGID